MVESPSSAMRERLRALCRQITVAEEIDPEIQEELLTHMEDKLRAYLNGSEQVTEEDAFILVREHFGDPAVVKALLQHTHVQESNLSLGRRLVAISAVSMVCTAILKISTVMCGAALVWIAARTDPELRIWAYLWTVWSMVSVCALAPILWFVVCWWRRTVDSGSRPWFIRWPRTRLALLLAGLVLMLYAIPSVTIDGIELGIPTSSTVPTMIAFGGMGVACIAIALQVMAWLWWCDRPPRAKKALSYATLTWALIGAACGSLPMKVLVISAQPPKEYLTLLNLLTVETHGAISNANPLEALLSTRFVLFTWMFVMLIAYGYAGRGFYWLALRYGRRLAGALSDKPKLV